VNTPLNELIFAAMIVVVLLGMGGYYAWRQWQVLASLRHQDDLAPDDRAYQFAQAWRRLVGCFLMVVLAILLSASYLIGQEDQAQKLGQAPAAGAEEADPAADAAHRRLLGQYGKFWIVFSFILFLLVALAFWDILAIRRFGVRTYRRIQSDRRAMIEDQLARLRSQRNGHK
jgi:hypothetical protein